MNDAAATVAAGDVVEGGTGPGREPHVKRIDKYSVRIVWIHRHPLVVPVLRIIALSACAVSEGTARGPSHKAPGCACVSGGKDAELTAVGVAAAAIAVKRDRTD